MCVPAMPGMLNLVWIRQRPTCQRRTIQPRLPVLLQTTGLEGVAVALVMRTSKIAHLLVCGPFIMSHGTANLVTHSPVDISFREDNTDGVSEWLIVTAVLTDSVDATCDYASVMALSSRLQNRTIVFLAGQLTYISSLRKPYTENKTVVTHTTSTALKLIWDDSSIWQVISASS